MTTVLCLQGQAVLHLSRYRKSIRFVLCRMRIAWMRAVNSMPAAAANVCPACPHPACSCSTAGWRCSGAHGAGPPGRAPSGRCSGWPLTGPATGRAACSPPAPAQRTGEAAKGEGEKKRNITPGTKALLFFFDYLNVPHGLKQGDAGWGGGGQAALF